MSCDPPRSGARARRAAPCPTPAPPPARRSGRAPRGHTLAELLAALAVLGVLAGAATFASARIAAREGVRAAAAEVRDAFAAARLAAVARGAAVAVRVDTLAGAVLVHASDDTLLRTAPGAAHGVRLAATRDSMAYAGGSGLGHGAANLTLILRRAAAVETVTVSRLGRVR